MSVQSRAWPHNIDRLIEHRFGDDDPSWISPRLALDILDGDSAELMSLAGTSQLGTGIIETAADEVILSRPPERTDWQEGDLPDLGADLIRLNRVHLPASFWANCTSQFWASGLFIARFADVDVFAEGVRFDRLWFEERFPERLNDKFKAKKRPGRYEKQWFLLMKALVELSRAGRLDLGKKGSVASNSDLLRAIMMHPDVNEVERADEKQPNDAKVLPVSETIERQIKNLWDELNRPLAPRDSSDPPVQ